MYLLKIYVLHYLSVMKKIDVDIPRCVRHDKYAQTVESCSNPFFLEVYRKMNPCVVRTELLSEMHCE
jgi:hypothetical protein